MRIADPNDPRPVPQGDVLFRRVDQVPDNVTEKTRRNGERLIVAHSETGHHHAIEAADVRLFESQGGLVAYLQVSGPYADVEHLRPWNTHETIRLPSGTWEIRRQREHTPEGWRRVED